MKTTINILTGLMIVSFIIISPCVNGTGIIISGAGKISGNIRFETSNLPLENSTITLFSTKDSSMIAGTITDKNGHFSFSMLEPGNYFLVISESGFEKQQTKNLSVKDSEPKICLNEIVLKPNTTSGKKRIKLLK